MARSKAVATHRIICNAKVKKYQKIYRRKHSPYPAGGVKRAYKLRPGTAAIRDIRRYQKSTECLLKRLPFSRVVKEIMQELNCKATCMTKSALDAIRDAAQDFIVQMFEDATLCTIHRKAVTLKVEDMVLAGKLSHGLSNYGGHQFYPRYKFTNDGEAAKLTNPGKPAKLTNLGKPAKLTKPRRT